jgi:hypothetical protein
MFRIENIALEKPAWQLNPYNTGGDGRFDVKAGNAVDGLKSNLSVWGKQCVISGINKTTAIWRVDLEDIRSIRHIVIYYRTENSAWGNFFALRVCIVPRILLSIVKNLSDT